MPSPDRARRHTAAAVRTQREIERERYALKALRGDFDEVPAPGAALEGARVRAVLRAINR